MDKPVSRRDVLDKAICGAACLGLCAAAAPVPFYLWAPEGGAGGGPAKVSLASLAAGEVKRVVVRGRPAMVIRTEAGLDALSAVCTHAGCTVKWDAAAKQFLCPCHGGRFDLAGKVVSGPPPKPLAPLEVKIAGDTATVG